MLTAIAFLAAFALGLGLAIFRNPLYGLYTYIAVFYLDAPSRWWGKSLPDLRWSFLAAIVTWIAMMRLKSDRERLSWYRTGPAVFLIAYTLWLWIQSPWALDQKMHFEAATYFSKYIIVYYIVYKLIDTPERVADFVTANMLGCFYLGWLAWTQPGSGGRLDGVGGPGIDDSNTLGMHMAAVAVAGAMVLFATKKWRRAICVLALPFMLNTIVMAGSRGAFLALVAGGLVLFRLRPREDRKLFTALAVIGVLGFGAVASTTFWERMGTLQAAVDDNQQFDNSAEGRIAQFHAGLRMFVEHPLGVGHRGFANLSASYLPAEYLDAVGVRSSHNTFITTLVEQGLPGAIMYIALLIWIARSITISREKALAGYSKLEMSMLAGACAGLVVVTVGGLFADFLKTEIQIWLCALLASLGGTVRIPAAQRYPSRARINPPPLPT